MTDNIERFDMAREPVRTRWYMRPFTYLLSITDVLLHKVQINYIGGTKELYFAWRRSIGKPCRPGLA